MTSRTKTTLATLSAILVGIGFGFFTFVLILKVIKTPRPPRVTPQYTVTDLGTLDMSDPDLSSLAFGLNDGGDVVGLSHIKGSSTRGFVYKSGQMTQIGTFGNPSSSGSAINNHGQVAGDAATHTGDDHGFLLQSGHMHDIGTLGGHKSSVSAINAMGQVVGQSTTHSTDQQTHAFLYEHGKMRDLGTLGGIQSCARDINDLGQIVGDAATTSGARHAVVWDHGHIRDIGAAIDKDTIGYAINHRGDIVGGVRVERNRNGYHAFYYHSGVFHELPTFGGLVTLPSDLNDRGEMVGYANVPVDDNPLHPYVNSHAFVYRNGKMTDLNTLIDPADNWILEHATAINTRGQIVGWGMHGDASHAFLLTPIR